VREGLYYNPYFPGGAIAMPRMLADGGVEYDDGTPSNSSQQAKVGGWGEGEGEMGQQVRGGQCGDGTPSSAPPSRSRWVCFRRGVVEEGVGRQGRVDGPQGLVECAAAC
jgi:hypothetical protein